MARKAKDILKARGYTDEQLTAGDAASWLSNPAFVALLEAEDTENERIRTEHEGFKTRLDNVDKWYRDYADPLVKQSKQNEVNYRKKIAGLEAQLAAEQEVGLRAVADGGQGGQGGQGAGAGGGQGAGQGQGGGQGGVQRTADPDFTQFDSRYITTDTFQQAYEQTGHAIAMMNDIEGDYRELFGKRLPGGSSGLRREYLDARRAGTFNGDIQQFAEKKYKFVERREELSREDAAKHEKEVGDAAIQKYISEHGNPLTRPMTASSSPFYKRTGTDGQGKRDGTQPWDRGTVEQRSRERVVKFAQKELQNKV